MNVLIHRVETLVPPHSSSQETLAGQFGSWAADPTTARVIRHVFRQSGIQRRHSVLSDFIDRSHARLFRTDEAGRLLEPTTQERNRCFAESAKRLSVDLAERLLDGVAGFKPSDVTHVVTVSCTGCVNPGPDWHIVTELGLSPSVERYHLGFMGCYAALPALRMAKQFCQARPDAVVLVICVELCSLHMQMRTDSDATLANALFSDGVAGVLVSGFPAQGSRPVISLDHFMSALAPEGQREMAWEVGDRGFNLVLSSYVPDVIAANVGVIVNQLLGPREMGLDDVDLWAVHPGGKLILDKVEDSLGLGPDQLQASREVLREFGNMSSATLLFVLERMLSRMSNEPRAVTAMAFGPGLTIESALLRLLPAGHAAQTGEGTLDEPAMIVRTL